MNKIEEAICYKFKNKRLLLDSMSHSSIKKSSVQFERLEFLGDRILGIVIAEHIFKSYHENEGLMSKMYSALVCANACKEIAANIGIDKTIKTAGSHLKTNKTVLSDAMEALLGAIFIDSNYETTKNIILNLWKNLFKLYDANDQEPKTQLQELMQAKAGEVPIYVLISVTGPDHQPIFSVSASGLGKIAYSVGNSRKIAETNAAKILLEELKKPI